MNKKIFSIIIFFNLFFNQVVRVDANDNTYINSNNIIYNEEDNIVELSENSKINYKNTNILIDRGIIDYNNNEFQVFGNFYLYEDLTILSGENLKGTTNLNFFTAEDISFIYNDDLKIDADYLDKNENIIYFYNNFLTPCELNGYFNCPTWSLRIDKTHYNITEDKYIHFDTFLQIADYKVFYMPYFTHYGAKAPRKKGFLTPSIEFTIGGGQGVKTPYYLPLNQSSDMLITPKFYLSESFEFLEKYELKTFIQNKSSGGNTQILIDNIKKDNSSNINTSLKIDTKQVLNKNKIFSASGLFTNSVSTTRSINDQPLTFEDIYLRLENYDFFIKKDYLKIELSSIESFENTNLNSIPIAPSVNYLNFIRLKDNYLISELDFIALKRDESSLNNPSEGYKIKFNTEFNENLFYKSLHINNKISLNNSINDYYFNKNTNLDHKSYKSNLIVSSDISLKKFITSTPRVKLIIPSQLTNSNKTINENSGSITFNYRNQYSENRFFGNDLLDTSPRIVYGFENNFNLGNSKIEFNFNQSYQTNLNSSYANKINQNSNFSDYAVKTKLNMEKFSFSLNTRLDYENLSKKEMNYALNFQGPINLSLIYNETQAEAFKSLSNETQSLNIGISKRINNNINFNYNSNLDLKNNYNPYKSVFTLSLFDECSQLDINYSNARYNDNYNTQPEEIISIRYTMDYLGFFGYEQSTNLFFKEPGKFDNSF